VIGLVIKNSILLDEHEEIINDPIWKQAREELKIN
jgi:hypothetical protein